jgi:hypothetical protein
MFSVAPWDSFRWRHDQVRVEELHAADDTLMVEVVKEHDYNSPRWRAAVPLGQFLQEATPANDYGDERETVETVKFTYVPVPFDKLDAVLEVLNA